MRRCDISLNDLSGCATAFTYGGGRQNVVNLRLEIQSGDTGFDLNGSLPDYRDEFSINFEGAGSNVGMSKQRAARGVTGDGTSTTFTVPFKNPGLIKTPSAPVLAQTALPGVSAYRPSVEHTQNYTSTGFDVVLESVPADGNTVTISYEACIGGMQ